MRSALRSLLTAATTILALTTGITPASAAPPTPGTVAGATDRSGVTIQPAGGRERVSFTQGTGKHGEVLVFPYDAMGLLAAGKLDERLFDVTGLLADQEARQDRLPLVLRYASPEAAQQRTADLRADGAEVKRVLPSISAVSAAVTQPESAKFWKAVNPASPVHARPRLSFKYVKAPSCT